MKSYICEDQVIGCVQIDQCGILSEIEHQFAVLRWIERSAGCKQVAVCENLASTSHPVVQLDVQFQGFTILSSVAVLQPQVDGAVCSGLEHVGNKGGYLGQRITWTNLQLVNV